MKKKKQREVKGLAKYCNQNPVLAACHNESQTLETGAKGKWFIQAPAT